MPKDSCLRREKGRYLRRLEEQGVTRKYWLEQRRIISHFVDFLEERSITCARNLRIEDARDFLEQYKGFSAIYQKVNWMLVRKFMLWINHPAALDLRAKVSGSARTRIRWLSREQAELIMSQPMKTSELMLIRGCLCMGLRRIEVLRISVKDARQALADGRLRVRGKFGKQRPVKLSPEFRDALIIALEEKVDPDPEEMLLGFGVSRSYDILEIFIKRTGVDQFGFHDLRRSFGKFQIEAGTSMSALRDIYGHKDCATTELYVGTSMQETDKAMSEFRILENPTVPPKPAR